MAQKKNPGGRPSFDGVIHTWKVPADIEQLYKEHGINWLWDAIRQFNNMDSITQRFTLEAVGNNKWRVTDTKNNVSITFVEGLFNSNQKSDTSHYTGDPLKVATIMREIGDYMAAEHYNVAMCNIGARKSLIDKLSRASWYCVVNALNGLVDDGSLPARVYVTADVEDLLHYENFDPEHEAQILQEVRSLTEEEAREAINMVDNFFDAEIYSFPEWVVALPQWSENVTIEAYLTEKENKLYALTTSRLRGYKKDNWHRCVDLHTGNYIDTLRQYNDDIQDLYNEYLEDVENNDELEQRAQNFLNALEEILDQINHGD